MNETLAVPMPGICPTNFDELATLVGLSPTQAHNDLSPKTEKLVMSVRSIVDDAVLQCIERKTADEFRRDREKVYPSYFALSVALSRVAEQAIPLGTLERLINESFCESEAQLRDSESLARLGPTVRDQAIFTVWTLRKTADLLLKIAKNPVNAANKKADAAFGNDFSAYAVWASFHMECLSAAIRHEKTIYPEVSEVVLDGLRAAVNAYAFARQGIDLRIPQEEPSLPRYEWDDEDRELLASSMEDVDDEDA